MDEFLLVDGYNIIHAWPLLEGIMKEDLSHARDRLIDILAEYQALKHQKVIIVFDAHLVKGGAGVRELYNGVEVIYTQEGETADALIERLVATYTAKGTVIVATSDWNQQRLIFGKGAYRMPARELLAEVNQYVVGEKHKHKAPRYNDHSLGGRLAEDIRAVLEKLRRQK